MLYLLMKVHTITNRHCKKITENTKPVMVRASRSCPNGVKSTSETLALVVLLNVIY